MSAFSIGTFRTSDGCDLRVRRAAGHAADNTQIISNPVLMLHSLFFTGEMFESLLPSLPGSAQVYAPDHRGQGDSDTAGKTPSISRLASDMIELIEGHIGAPVHLVGSSMGGYVAMQMAIQRPDLLKSLTLSCCTAHAEKQPERFAALEARIREQGSEPMVDALLETMFGEAFIGSGSIQCKTWRERFIELPKRIADAVHEVFARSSFESSVRDLPMPLLLVSGQLDRAKRPDDMDFIHKIKNGSRHLVIPDAGHTPPVETPQVFAEALLEVWRKVEEEAPVKPTTDFIVCFPT